MLIDLERNGKRNAEWRGLGAKPPGKFYEPSIFSQKHLQAITMFSSAKIYFVTIL